MIRRPPRSTLFPSPALFRSPPEQRSSQRREAPASPGETAPPPPRRATILAVGHSAINRSEEHTSELQSRSELVCRLLLEKQKERMRTRASRHLDPDPS